MASGNASGTDWVRSTIPSGSPVSSSIPIPISQDPTRSSLSSASRRLPVTPPRATFPGVPALPIPRFTAPVSPQRGTPVRAYSAHSTTASTPTSSSYLRYSFAVVLISIIAAAVYYYPLISGPIRIPCTSNIPNGLCVDGFIVCNKGFELTKGKNPTPLLAA